MAVSRIRVSGAGRSRWYAGQCVVALGLWAMVAISVLLGLGEAAYGEDEVVGVVRTVDGTAAILRGEQRLAATVGLPIRRNDVLRTSGGATLAVVLRDMTMISIGPNTRFTIEDYQFEPSESRYSFLGILLGGSFLYASGAIGRLSPDSVAVRTPVGIIGIRGTRFSASYAP